MGDLEQKDTTLLQLNTGKSEEGLRILARIISRHLEEESGDRDQDLLKSKLPSVLKKQKDEKKSYG